MDFKRFSILIALRTGLIILNLVILTYLVSASGYHVTCIVAVAVLLIQCYLLISFVTKTNQELTRFLDAIRYADFAQRFDMDTLGSGFGELGNAFAEILERFNQQRTKQESQQRHLKAIVEHVPVPLISIQSNGNLTLWNHAARKLFGANHVTKLTDLQSFGQEFAEHLSKIKPGERRLVNFAIDGMQYQLSLSATKITLPDNQETLVSMQDIQNELDGAQLQAWQDLVKVLTHEIMNSITPVASLANTAVSLVKNTELKTKNQPELAEDLQDISDAVNTVARRSDGLIQFVGSYRKLTQLPTANKTNIRLKTLIDHVTTLASQDWKSKNIKLDVQLSPSELEVSADADMLTQVLLNLLKNAEQALLNKPQAQVGISAFLNPRGHVVIEVSDNGTGINDETARQIFVPFFTTKQNGSGVGLALTRQIMLAHNGNVKYMTNSKGGATFSLRF
ncbi:sensor histidine kinase [Paraglaciecola sp.]|uniref:sensor histidine kinase n=1 Tax=Paraglaciecola sp. TaxID=1920173 RepID=UPI003EF6BA23